MPLLLRKFQSDIINLNTLQHHIMKNKINLILLLFVITTSLNAQSDNTELIQAIQTVLQTDPDTGRYNFSIVSSYPPEDILQAVSTYDNHENPKIRSTIQLITSSLIKKDLTLPTRKKLVEKLVQQCFDSYPLIWQSASKWLKEFTCEDFSETAKDQLRLLLTDEYLKYNFILLAGVADLQDQEQRLEQIIDEYESNNRERSMMWHGRKSWAAKLALARMGNEQYMQEWIKGVEAEPLAGRRVTVLLKHLAYMRQEPAIVVLQKYLDSDKKLPPACHGIGGQSYARRALQLLTPILNDFPVKVDRFGLYKSTDITTARQWMKTQKTFSIKR